MSTYNLEMQSIPSRKLKKGGVYSDSMAYVAIKISQPITINEKRQVQVISPIALSEKEFESQINRLIRELNIVKTNGRKFFKREIMKKRKWLEKSKES
jgi:hypothetical protein